MYSGLKSIQILVALLKKHGIFHVVISPGGADRDLARSIESDPDFTCYSVVDERSAAYFGVGVAQSLGTPVAILCTSGTAVCNYLSAVTEAFYQSVPLVVITADRNPYLLDQLETQKINQVGIFGDVCRKCVTLPVVNNDDDFWYCERLINEAILELNHHGVGPVHINIPTHGLQSQRTDCVVEKLPDVVAMHRITAEADTDDWIKKAEELCSYKRIMVVCGQNRACAAEEIEQMDMFFAKFNCLFSVENLSNVHCEGAVSTYPVSETTAQNEFEKLVPDLVISLGDNFAATSLKGRIRRNRGKFAHWLIDERGVVKDVFKGLSVIFECSPERFFKEMNDFAPASATNDRKFFEMWVAARSELVIPEFPFSNIYVAQELAHRVPEHSILHLGILNSTRHMQFFSLSPSIEVYSNIGALGIDGSMSTFFGQAAATEKLCFLLIGDLSFFYDMNSLGIRHIGANVRILVVNNRGGGEFHFSAGGMMQYPEVDKFISVRHEQTVKGWVESIGFRYLSASDKDEMESALDTFVSPSDGPVVLEAFTDMKTDGEIVLDFYASNSNKGARAQRKAALLNASKKVLGESGTEKARKAYRKIVGH